MTVSGNGVSGSLIFGEGGPSTRAQVSSERRSAPVGTRSPSGTPEGTEGHLRGQRSGCVSGPPGAGRAPWQVASCSLLPLAFPCPGGVGTWAPLSALTIPKWIDHRELGLGLVDFCFITDGKCQQEEGFASWVSPEFPEASRWFCAYALGGECREPSVMGRGLE